MNSLPSPTIFLRNKLKLKDTFMCKRGCTVSKQQTQDSNPDTPGSTVLLFATHFTLGFPEMPLANYFWLIFYSSPSLNMLLSPINFHIFL